MYIIACLNYIPITPTCIVTDMASNDHPQLQSQTTTPVSRTDVTEEEPIVDMMRLHTAHCIERSACRAHCRLSAHVL